jgi:hypothetical protein
VHAAACTRRDIGPDLKPPPPPPPPPPPRPLLLRRWARDTEKGWSYGVDYQLADRIVRSEPILTPLSRLKSPGNENAPRRSPRPPRRATKRRIDSRPRVYWPRINFYLLRPLNDCAFASQLYLQWHLLRAFAISIYKILSRTTRTNLPPTVIDAVISFFIYAYIRHRGISFYIETVELSFSLSFPNNTYYPPVDSPILLYIY